MQSLLISCWQLSDTMIYGVPEGITQVFKNVLATCDDVVFGVKMARVDLPYRSVILITSWLPELARRRGQRM